MKGCLTIGLVVLLCLTPVGVDAVCPDKLEPRDHPHYPDRLELHPDCDLEDRQKASGIDKWSAAAPDLEIDLDVIDHIETERTLEPSEESTTMAVETDIAWRIQFTWNLAKLFESNPGR